MGDVQQEAEVIVEKYRDGTIHKTSNEALDEAIEDARWAAGLLAKYATHTTAPLHLANVTEEGREGILPDWKLELKLPNGKTVFVLIPKSFCNNKDQKSGVDDGSVYGLNLVTEWHYT